MYSVYLAGPLDYAHLGDHANWRDTLQNSINHRLGAAAPLLFSPNRPYSNALNDVEALVAINMAAVRACKMLVAAIFPEQPSWGTPIEVYEARQQGKPVLLWVPDGECPAYLQADTEKFVTLGDLLERMIQILRNDTDSDYSSTSLDLLYENGGIHYPKMHGDVGYDVECMQDTVLPGASMLRVPLGFDGAPLRVKAPKGTWFSILPRSSIVDRGILVSQTVCDEGYTGDLFSMMYNTKPTTQTLEKGTRIGQIVLFNSVIPQLRRVSVLPITARGSNGFGSTGK